MELRYIQVFRDVRNREFGEQATLAFRVGDYFFNNFDFLGGNNIHRLIDVIENIKWLVYFR